MNIAEFKRRFNNILTETYPEREVNSFFNILSEAYLGMSRLEVALKPQKELSTAEREKLEEALVRLRANEPIQYITGKTEFFGLPFRVNKSVLIPRPETEELVEWVLNDLQKSEAKAPGILDIGTGSGCIAIALAKNLPNANITAVDISEDALETAKRNAEDNKVKIDFLKLDILKTEKLPSVYDIIVSNPPYVREQEKKTMHYNVLNHEPTGALYVKDEDPLVFYEKITLLAKGALTVGGQLYFEINQYLGEETKSLLTNNYFSASLKKDIFGNDRMLKGKLPANLTAENEN